MWVGSHFVNAEMVAFQSPVDAAPYQGEGALAHDLKLFVGVLQSTWREDIGTDRWP